LPSSYYYDDYYCMGKKHTCSKSIGSRSRNDCLYKSESIYILSCKNNSNFYSGNIKQHVVI
jgi:hypothetical protein